MEAPSSSAALARSARGEGEIQQTNLRVSQSMESGYLFPERPGEPDCDYYIRTGHCRFGMTCKFNHPPNRNLVVVSARMRGGYPERAGQPECQYYLRTGSCKFGATCKFHHPKDKAGILGQIQLNVLGYPLHPNEKECSYYLRTGQCKFGNTCKFHHPEPSNTEYVNPPDSSVYPSVQSHTAPGAQNYPGGSAQWSLSRAYSSQQWQSPSSYTQLVLPQGLAPVPSWTAYPGQLGDSSSESQQLSGALHFYNTSQQSDAIRGAQGSFASYQPGSVAMGMYTVQSEAIFPERPDQPECQYYMKTGDCKFGALCKFHHPRERSLPPPDSVLSTIGLPLRPGEPVCRFYSRYGICKFGPSCKFDHPMVTLSYGPSASSIEESQAGWHPSGSLAGPAASVLLSEGPLDPSSGMSQQIRISETQIASDDQDIEAD